MENKTILKAIDLSIGYRHKKESFYVGKAINFELEAGKMVCLLGKNGIGKSTLLRTISKMQSKLSGTVLMKDKDMEAVKETDLAKDMSLVLTERIPESQLTVFELVALGRQPYTNWLGKLSEKDRSLIDDAMELVGIAAIAHKRNYELSDGQLQKVMIARALAQDTPLIVLDEPTAHLDMHHKIEVFNILKALVNNTGKTILLSTHEVNLAIKMADDLWLMSESGFNAGTCEDLIASHDLDTLFPRNLVVFNSKTKQFEINN